MLRIGSREGWENMAQNPVPGSVADDDSKIRCVTLFKVRLI